MTFRRNITIALLVGTAAALAAVSVQAQMKPTGEKIHFPKDYAKGVLYGTVDRADNKQYRELYTSQAAVDAAKKGQPVPDGTIVTLVQYAAKLDAQGNPEKGANGRFVKTNIVGYTVMEKRKGWGADIPAEIRNGDWQYRAFRADQTPNPQANLENCYKCHKPLDAKVDFLFSYDRMAGTKK